jgi:Leucine-rich repeat (LRR) protein
MKIFVDIDETICFYDGVERLGYKNSIPNYKNIEKINKLYDEGNEITYWTARGTISKIDYLDLTKSQLNSWGCKYHNLSVGEKPAYDLLICDKTKRIEEI